jgi:hypothetical protein
MNSSLIATLLLVCALCYVVNAGTCRYGGNYWNCDYMKIANDNPARNDLCRECETLDMNIDYPQVVACCLCNDADYDLCQATIDYEWNSI